VLRRRKAMRVASPVKVLSDRTIQHKYINPNLLAVATLKHITASEDMVSLYLVDAVSGHVLHHSTHPHTSTPVNLAISDNDVYMSLWNQASRQHELVAMELMESRDKDDTLSIVLGNLAVPKDGHNLTHYSSFSRKNPEVLTRQYLLPRPAVSLAVTETARGVSAKQLLVGLVSDQVLALDRRFIDPRQTLKPSAAEKEEGMLPYNMKLPLMPPSLVSYNNTVSGLRFVDTEPGEFESQSQMLAVGIDLLFVPLTPSGTFDQLSDDFSRGALMAAMIGLAVVTVVLSVVDRNRELKKKWM